jgi:hypothetical protein
MGSDRFKILMTSGEGFTCSYYILYIGSFYRCRLLQNASICVAFHETPSEAPLFLRRFKN